MGRNVTINTIAKTAGVSRGTVDRVLNQRGHVEPRTAERVLQVMRDLDYTPKKDIQLEAIGMDPSINKIYRIGIILSNEQGYFKEEMLRGIQDAAAALPSTEIFIEECKTALSDELLEKMEAMRQKEVMGLVVHARDQITVREEIAALAGDGIPVITLNTDLPGSQRILYVGQDTYKSGRIAGDLMTKCASKEDRILICIGNLEYGAHANRLNGFKDRLRELNYPADSLDILETHNDFETTHEKVSAYLTDHPELKGIYMANRSVTGCTEAVREAGRRGTIHIIGHDLTDASRRLLKSNELDFVIAQDLARQSYTALTAMNEYIISGKIQELSGNPKLMNIFCAENCDE